MGVLSMFLAIIAVFFSFFSTVTLYADTQECAQKVLESVSYVSPSSFTVIGEKEWQELQLDRLVTILDRTKTSFGPWGLRQLLQPIADYDELRERQNIISFLVNNEDVLVALQDQLQEIYAIEKSLLSYWDDKDKLAVACEQFYYNIPVLKKYCNKSSLALNAGVAVTMMDAWRGLFINLCLQGVSQEWTHWLHSDQEGFDFVRGIKNGLQLPMKQHSLELDIFKDRDASYEYTTKDYINAVNSGSLGDRYHIFSRGYSYTNWLSGEVSSPSMSAISKTNALLLAGMQTIAYDYTWGSSLMRIGGYIKLMHSSLNNLHDRVIDVQSFCKSIENIKQTVDDNACFYGRCDFDINNKDLLSLMASCKSVSDNYYLYSRGKVLCIHNAIKNTVSSLVPLLQSVALLDAYCSIAQLYREGQKQKNSFTFAQFAQADRPFVVYDGVWLALLPSKNAVANNFYMGNTYALKSIFTGPNGGGKSTILKAGGIAAVLAQSWGIVPAQSAYQTIFTHIRTGIATRESLEHGLSTFMAEKKCMEDLFECIQRSDRNNHMLVLIDEPYKGTVDEESAKRIYSFGKSIAYKDYALVTIATHVKKPIQLAIDTQGIFANYHVEIREKSLGVFERLFTVKEGPATWWFEDEDKRGRFIDWISGELRKNQPHSAITKIDGLSSLLYP